MGLSLNAKAFRVCIIIVSHGTVPGWILVSSLQLAAASVAQSAAASTNTKDEVQWSNRSAPEQKPHYNLSLRILYFQVNDTKKMESAEQSHHVCVVY